MTEPAATSQSAEQQASTGPAWSDGALRDPHAVADKARRVRDMFDAIAPSYDLNNRLHSLWRDQAWRRAAVRFAQLDGDETVVDIACGTGDLAIAFADALTLKGEIGELGSHVIGIDFTEQMLPIARSKWQRHPMVVEHADEPFYNPVVRDMVQFLGGDAMALPLPDACCDVVSIAFGIRNVVEPQRATAEFHRVLRPGGRLVILEFSLPGNRLLRSLYQFYFQHVLPRTATLIARDRSGAYRYLPRSVSTFLPREKMLELMRVSGFEDCVCRPLTFGIAVLYRGIKR